LRRNDPPGRIIDRGIRQENAFPESDFPEASPPDAREWQRRPQKALFRIIAMISQTPWQGVIGE
jgi:hypothetical protein